MFEITLVRLSETSDYLLGQVNNPLAVIRRTSEKIQPDFICHYNNAVIKRQNLRNSCPGSVRAAIVTKLLLASAQMPLKLILSGPQRMTMPRSGLSQDIM